MPSALQHMRNYAERCHLVLSCNMSSKYAACQITRWVVRSYQRPFLYPERIFTFQVMHVKAEEADVARQLEALESEVAGLQQQKRQLQEDFDAHLALRLSVQQATQVNFPVRQLPVP